MKISEYDMTDSGGESDGKGKLHIALVSDLHERDPECVIRTLAELKPDLILFPGDLMERHERGESSWNVAEMDAWQGISKYRTWFTKVIKTLDGSLFSGKNPAVKYKKENGYRFLRETAPIAPLILSMGNHEWYYRLEDYELFRELGVHLLDNADIELQVGGRSLLLGGLSTRYDLEWLDHFAGKAGEKILLMHHPDYYYKYIKDTPRDVFDLIVAGHTHGGQWRLFSHGGEVTGLPVFAPGQGLFPKHAYGREGRLIISSGVANTTSIPRFGNPCEVVMIHF